MKVELLKCGDTELDIVNIARVSTDKWFEEWVASRDEPLIETLVFEEHWTPMGQIQLRFRMEMPLVIARQYLRSQVGQTFNEMSRRYVGMEEPPKVWWPKVWRGKPPKKIKQGSSGPLDDSAQLKINSVAANFENVATHWYEKLITEDGAAPEQARWFLPQGTETKFIQTGSLAYYQRVCGLRRDPHAQAEVRMIAQELDSIISKLFPFTWKCMMFLEDEKSKFRQMVKDKWRAEKKEPGSTTLTTYLWKKEEVESHSYGGLLK